MKKIFLALLAALMCAGVVFAQGGVRPSSDTPIVGIPVIPVAPAAAPMVAKAKKISEKITLPPEMAGAFLFGDFNDWDSEDPVVVSENGKTDVSVIVGDKVLLWKGEGKKVVYLYPSGEECPFFAYAEYLGKGKWIFTLDRVRNSSSKWEDKTWVHTP